MRTYDAIDIIGKEIIQDNLCDAIILKGSIGRGDDDEYSDVDMYLIVSEANKAQVMAKRREYLSAYMDLVYLSEANFGLPQVIAIYENALHVDLYVATLEEMTHTDPVKVYYDPKGLFADDSCERGEVSQEEAAECFQDALYYFVEADSAYRRKNYAWTIHIMSGSIADAAILLRYSYDKKYAFLGLKKINQIIPREQYLLLEQAHGCLGIMEFQKANEYILQALDIFVESASEELRGKLNLKMYDWVRKSLGNLLFVE